MICCFLQFSASASLLLCYKTEYFSIEKQVGKPATTVPHAVLLGPFSWHGQEAGAVVAAFHSALRRPFTVYKTFSHLPSNFILKVLSEVDITVLILQRKYICRGLLVGQRSKDKDLGQVKIKSRIIYFVFL